MRKNAIVIWLLIALLAALPLLGGCAKKEEPPTPAPPTPAPPPPPAKKPVVKVGGLFDFSGPIATHGPLAKIIYGEDNMDLMAKYRPLPVDIEFLWYDNKFDPAKGIEGYKYVVEQGAIGVFGPYSCDAETIYKLAPEYKVPFTCGSSSLAAITPPGWVFTYYAPYMAQAVKFLEWLTTEGWDYEAMGRSPKIGSVGWRIVATLETSQGAEAYCKAHPDKLEWVGAEIVPPGTMSYAAEAERLKGCDYIFLACAGAFLVPFMKEAAAKGYEGKFIIHNGVQNWNLLRDAAGKSFVDGCIALQVCGWYTDDTPGGEVVRGYIGKHWPTAEEKQKIYGEYSYCSLIACFLPIFEGIRIAAQDVGPENITGEAVYQALQKLDYTAKDFGIDGWHGPVKTSPEERICMNYTRIYRYSAERDRFEPVTDWLSLKGMWPVE